jgi:hypothetical protein
MKRYVTSTKGLCCLAVKSKKKRGKVEKDRERGNNMYRQKRMGKIQREEGDEAVKLKDVGNFMLDFSKSPLLHPGK